jgi:hypothetical protein
VNFPKLLFCVYISEHVYLKIDRAMLNNAVSKVRNLTAIHSTTPWIQVYSLTVHHTAAMLYMTPEGGERFEEIRSLHSRTNECNVKTALKRLSSREK